MRLRASLAGLALALGALGPHALAVSPACAGAGPRAVLVIDDGTRVMRLCVALDAAEVSGIHLIELAGRQHGLTYSLGFGGQAVCMLARTGPEGPDCFSERPYFWGLWRGGAAGRWSWSAVGAGSMVIEDGDVEGWSWGAGASGADHPPPPAIRPAAVCGSGATSPSAPPEPSPSPQPAPSASPQPEVVAEPTPASTPKSVRRRSPVPRRARAEPRPSTAPSPLPPSATGEASPGPPPGGGPSAAGVAGLGGAVIVAGLGLWRVGAGPGLPSRAR